MTEMMPEESPLVPIWEQLDIPEIDDAEPEDAGDGDDDG